MLQLERDGLSFRGLSIDLITTKISASIRFQALKIHFCFDLHRDLYRQKVSRIISNYLEPSR
jgi:hypothetical protein